MTNNIQVSGLCNRNCMVTWSNSETEALLFESCDINFCCMLKSGLNRYIFLNLNSFLNCDVFLFLYIFGFIKVYFNKREFLKNMQDNCNRFWKYSFLHFLFATYRNVKPDFSGRIRIISICFYCI